MKTVYLDVSCLNRPFDDQHQTRIRLESEAVLLILERIEKGCLRQVSSQMAEIEIRAISDLERRRRVAVLLASCTDIIKLTPAMFTRANELEVFGLKAADALHVAAAEALKADIMLSCDDRLCRAAMRIRTKLAVRVANPLTWLKENPNASDA